MIRVLVVDDQALVRVGVKVLLEAVEGIEVVGEAGTGQEAIGLVERIRPDVVLMDLRMPKLDGRVATQRIVEQWPNVHVVVLTTFSDDASIYGALRAGAVGFLLKDSEPPLLVEAVRKAARGDPLLSPAVLSRVVNQAVTAHDATSPAPDAATDAVATLSGRERHIVALVGAGKSNGDIATQLHMGVTTVKTHVSAAIDKLGVANRVQVAVLAHRFGLVDSDFHPQLDPEKLRPQEGVRQAHSRK